MTKFVAKRCRPRVSKRKEGNVKHSKTVLNIIRNVGVVGSIPINGTIFFNNWHLLA